MGQGGGGAEGGGGEGGSLDLKQGWNFMWDGEAGLGHPP